MIANHPNIDILQYVKVEAERELFQISNRRMKNGILALNVKHLLI